VIKHRATVAYLEAQNKLEAPMRRLYGGIGFTLGIMLGIFIGTMLGR
jgi:formate/nitrite transporter FocA (FNT family)